MSQQLRLHIKSYFPGASLQEVNKRNLPKIANVAILGPRGAGKSSFINTVFTIVDARPVVINQAKVQSVNAEGTKHFEHHAITKNLYFYDTRGFYSFDNEEQKEAKNLTAGLVKDNTKLLRGDDSKSFWEGLQYYTSSNIKWWSSISQEMHAILFVIDASDETPLKYATAIVNNIKKNGLSVFALITHIDVMDGAEVSKLKKDVASSFNLDIASVYCISNYQVLGEQNLTTEQTCLTLLYAITFSIDQNLKIACKVN